VDAPGKFRILWKEQDTPAAYDYGISETLLPPSFTQVDNLEQDGSTSTVPLCRPGNRNVPSDLVSRDHGMLLLPQILTPNEPSGSAGVTAETHAYLQVEFYYADHSEELLIVKAPLQDFNYLNGQRTPDQSLAGLALEAGRDYVLRLEFGQRATGERPFTVDVESYDRNNASASLPDPTRMIRTGFAPYLTGHATKAVRYLWQDYSVCTDGQGKRTDMRGTDNTDNPVSFADASHGLKATEHYGYTFRGYRDPTQPTFDFQSRPVLDPSLVQVIFTDAFHSQSDPWMNRTLYAIYTPETFFIAYDPNGGLGQKSQDPVEWGAAYNLRLQGSFEKHDYDDHGNPVTDYTLLGWSLRPDDNVNYYPLGQPFPSWMEGYTRSGYPAVPGTKPADGGLWLTFYAVWSDTSTPRK